MWNTLNDKRVYRQIKVVKFQATFMLSHYYRGGGYISILQWTTVVWDSDS